MTAKTPFGERFSGSSRSVFIHIYEKILSCFKIFTKLHSDKTFTLMKYFAVISLLTIFFSSCQKSDVESNEPIATDLPTGLIVPTLAELMAIPTVESVDTGIVPIFSILQSPQSSSHVLTGFPTPGNQYLGSCVGWAVGYGMMSYFYNRIDGPYVASPTYIWNQLNGGDPNRGATYTAAMEILKTQGCSNTTLMPPYTVHTTQPSAQAKNNASNYKIHAYYRFDNVNLERIKSFLRRDYPLPVGLKIDRGFGYPNDPKYKSYDIDGVEYVYERRDGSTLGEHAVLIVGYDDNIGGNGAFKIMNSWSSNWANRGYVWIDYEIFKQMVVMVDTKPVIFWAVPGIARTSNDFSLIESNSARAGGKVDSYDGVQITAKGVCYSKTNDEPTIIDLKNNEGPGKGVFFSDLNNLAPNTVYYVRAYATTSNGTYYGIPKYFKTLPPDSVVIGTQTWTVRNLRATRYRNGDLINWQSNPNPSSRDEGLEYSWDAVNDIRGIAPVGWHVPTESEWQTLINYLGGFTRTTVVKLSTFFGGPPDLNSSGFTAGPYGPGDFITISGRRSPNATFWTATTVSGSPLDGYLTKLRTDGNGAEGITWFPVEIGRIGKNSYYNVRLIKD